ncbi:MAG: TonB-dependent receptor domain-containing protein [Gemmatimonadaceae bacterium]
MSHTPATHLIRRWPRIAAYAVASLGWLASPVAARAQATTPAATPAAAPAATQSAGRGFIAGLVIDKESGRPLEAANVVVIGTTFRTASDLDGRYRIGVPVGTYSVRVLRLGSAPTQLDSIRVTNGATTTANFALGSIALQLQSVAITAGPVRASSEDALLAMQKAAPRVSDGISAEAIKRAPGADASDAIVRVTGVSVVDNKFAVVRGLAERYSNTLLNGVELPSPEPLKKIVPLDLFPSSLLESIVVSKTATPDRPGDFAGGSVEVSTKEFPDQRVSEGSLSVGYGSQATFRSLSQLQQRGSDWFGYDSGNRRQMPERAGVPFGVGTPQSERFGEQLRNVWTPAPTTVLPDLGGSLNFGGRFGGDNAPFGYAVSGTYSRQVDATPNRLSQIVFDAQNGIPDQGYTSQEATTTTDVGAIANFAVRLGTTQKIGLKNLFTRNAEERLSETAGFETYNGNAERLIYQARFITRQLVQTQLTGDHLIAPLWNSRVEWRATRAVSERDEPENRSLIYFKTPTENTFRLSPSNPSPFWFRFLDDQVSSAQLDWSLPVTRVLRDGAQFKFGGMYRERNRSFDASFFRAWASPDPSALPILGLSPERVFSGEILGSALELRREGEGSLPYESDDDTRAYYAMLDAPITSWFRFVGGVRHEDWKLNLYQGTRRAPIGDVTQKRTGDDLVSANLTFSLSDRQNLRVAFYNTVARPDPREVSADYYIAVTGDCGNRGNPNLNSSKILNGDVRWEFYTRPGELISFSAFYKDFTDPIGELLSFPGSSECTTEYFNLESAEILGGELEFRRTLDFLPGALERMALGLNLTVVDSRATQRVDPTITREFALQGQSDILANLNLLYADTDGLDVSVLLNYFSDRIVRYGIANISAGVLSAVPNVMEQARVSLDAKIRKKLGRSTVSLSARNLTDNETIYYQDSDAGRTRTGYLRPGVSLSLGVGYAFR